MLVTLIPPTKSTAGVGANGSWSKPTWTSGRSCADSAAETLELVQGEMRTHRALGESFDTDEYHVRFPRLARAVRIVPHR